MKLGNCPEDIDTTVIDWVLGTFVNNFRCVLAATNYACACVYIMNAKCSRCKSKLKLA